MVGSHERNLPFRVILKINLIFASNVNAIFDIFQPEYSVLAKFSPTQDKTHAQLIIQTFFLLG